MSKIAYLILFSLLSLLGGCFSKTPNAGDVPGQYQLTQKSQKYLEQQYKLPLPSDTLITLGSDGSVILINIPDVMISGFGKPNKHFLSGEGTWELDQQGLCLHITKGELPFAYYASGFLDICDSRKGFILVSTIGDPDTKETLKFIKK